MVQKRVLSVQDISCFGKCSNTVALPVLSAAGFECVILPTALLSTHTGGFKGFSFLDLTEEMKKIVTHWKTLPLQLDAVLTGYFGNREQLSLVRQYLLEQGNLFRFVDPVMGDCGKLYSIYDGDFAAGMREFCEGADVITPNLTEACLLAGVSYRGDRAEENDLPALLRRLSELDIRKIVLTGVRFGAAEIGVVAFDAQTGRTDTFRTPFADTYLHGTGDTFASSLCARMLQGREFSDAIRDALDFTFASIQNTLQTDSRYGLIFEPELYRLTKQAV